MRNGPLASTVLPLVLFIFFATGCSGRFDTADEEAAKAIPDLSGIWDAPWNRIRKSQVDICGEPACDALQEALPPFQLIVTLEEPQMLPWAEEIFKSSREEGVEDPYIPGRETADPWFSACRPMSPAAHMLSPFSPVEIRQFSDMVLMLLGDDHSVRRIYLDGRGHPSDLKPTWMGHSVGRYEGDTLVVDTVAIKEQRWLDPQGHPHSDALQLGERIRRVSHNSLEIEVSITDPKAYKNSWRKRIVRVSAPPGHGFWEDVLCEELLQMGTHYGAEARQ